MLFLSFLCCFVALCGGQSLSDCKAIAAQFRNTCAHGDYDTPAKTVEGMDSETFICPNKRACIPGGVTIGTSCAWDRKVCVTCRVDKGVTKIRVQTNNLPDHCVKTNSMKAQNFDYEVKFNTKRTFGDWENNFNTQRVMDNAVCRIKKTYDVKSLGLVEYGAKESTNAMGFAINGVAFQFANQIEEDPVYPITATNEQPLDICLGHNQLNSDSGMYHYHDVSPCINTTFLDGKTVSECREDKECDRDIVAWSLSGYDSKMGSQVIGIAKDGHVLHGPYKDSGRLWEASDVDACNGAWSADKNEYSYVGTRWHPYVVGCQGPANFPVEDGVYPKCSRNGMDQYVGKANHTKG